MTYDSPPPDLRYKEITHFAGFRYENRKLLALILPVLATHLSIPGDYRTKKQIYDDYERNTRAMERRPQS